MERPVRHVQARSQDDIISAVRACRGSGVRLRAVGSAGSKNGNFLTAGVALHLDRYDGLVSVEDNLVTVQAGMTVGRLGAVLTSRGLALPTVGEWAGATVAGAVATGTHGGSAHHGICSTSVRSIRLVTADGQVVDLARGDHRFAHAGVSLGMLGLISTITFECVEGFHLALETRLESLDRYLLEHAAANRAHEFYSAVWIPTAGTVITFAANRAPPPRKTLPREERFSARTFVLSALARRLGVNALFTRRHFTKWAIDEWDRILSPIRSHSRFVRLLRRLSPDWRAVEFAVPLERAPNTVVALDRFLRAHPRALANPVGLRVSAQDGFSLSPCHGRAAFWVDLFFHDDAAFAASLQALFEEHDARCHWGKHIGLSPAHVRRQYPRWDEFRAARAVFDPDKVFANRFTEVFDL